MEKYTIHPLAKLIPKMTEEEYQSLKSDIQKNGIQTEIILFEDKILDGRHRYHACEELEIEAKFKQYKGGDPASFVISLNLERRHLTKSQLAALAVNFLPELEKEAKKRMSEGGKGTPKVADLNKGDSRDKAAEQFKVGHQYVSDVKKIKKDSPEKFEQILSGEKSISEIKDEILIEAGGKKVHVSNNSGNNEWYTPKEFIEASREVMGSIDVDPASSELANKTVKSKIFYTEKTNGLNKSWKGNIWMNPPYEGGLIDKFTSLLVEKFKSKEIEQAIVLVNNATETKWAQEMLKKCSAICFPKRRIKFIDQDGNPTGSPLQGQMFIYFGNKKAEFVEVFSNFGSTSLWNN